MARQVRRTALPPYVRKRPADRRVVSEADVPIELLCAHRQRMAERDAAQPAALRLQIPQPDPGLGEDPMEAVRYFQALHGVV